MAGLIALGMSKEMVRAALHYDFKVDLDDESFEALYSQAARCVEEGLVRVRSWATPFRPGDCDDEIVREAEAMILRGADEDKVVAELVRRHYIFRRGSAYRRLTQREAEYAYDVAMLCIKERAEARGR